MRRPPQARRPKPHHRRTKGEKANKKQMACVGAVYSIKPFVRTPDDVLDEVLRDRCSDDRPGPDFIRHVWAEMSRDVESANRSAPDDASACSGTLTRSATHRATTDRWSA